MRISDWSSDVCSSDLITTFDPALATSLGISAARLNAGLILMVAVTAVAAFEAVGSILVIAMFICPPATARMLTDRLSRQLALSVLFAVLSGVLGYVFAARSEEHTSELQSLMPI